MSRHYTEDELALLQRYAREGLGSRAAAQALGRGVSTVISTAKRHGFAWNREASARLMVENSVATRKAKAQRSGDWMTAEARERQREAVRVANHRRYAEPGSREAQAGKLSAQRAGTDFEDRRRAGIARRHAQRLDWCPADWRQTYEELRHKKISASEARAIIEAEIARTAARAERAAEQEREARFHSLRRSGGRPARISASVTTL